MEYLTDEDIQVLAALVEDKIQALMKKRLTVIRTSQIDADLERLRKIWKHLLAEVGTNASR